ncbi:unnamed protein product [Cuscuta europaea]|uniref:Uncharacterized protein n=1 Tax=Cuscuta europaea TaxID=41803 RepID=A0A9P0ZWU9_CUSEU|nr:unnamed protein product [Cuscuta europaea]
MTKKNKQNRTPPPKDQKFEDKIKYLQAKKAASEEAKMKKKGISKEVIPTLGTQDAKSTNDTDSHAAATPLNATTNAEASLAASHATGGVDSNTEASHAAHATGGNGSYAEALLGTSFSSHVEASKEPTLTLKSHVEVTTIETSDENHVIIEDEPDVSISLGSQDTEQKKN